MMFASEKWHKCGSCQGVPPKTSDINQHQINQKLPRVHRRSWWATCWSRFVPSSSPSVERPQSLRCCDPRHWEPWRRIKSWSCHGLSPCFLVGFPVNLTFQPGILDIFGMQTKWCGHNPVHPMLNSLGRCLSWLNLMQLGFKCGRKPLTSKGTRYLVGGLNPSEKY